MSSLPEPFDVGQIRASKPAQHLDYIAMDYESLKRRAVRYLAEQFPDDYNNFSESDYGIFLLELWSFLADQVSFKIDYTANQIFVQNTTELEHMLRLCRMVGYKMQPPTAAKAWVSATLEAPQNDDVVLNSRYLVEARGENETLLFELFAADSGGNPLNDTEIIIPAGSSVNTNIVAIEGETRTDSFTGDGNPYQRYVTTDSNAIYGSIEVWVNDIPWSEVDVLPLGASQNFTVKHNSEFAAEISFGNNVYGAIPPSGSDITIRYRIGGGRTGNIIRGAINEVASFPFRVADGTAAVTITNYEGAKGGSNGDDIEDIRRKIATPIRTQNRLVTGEDYRTFAENYTSQFQGKIGKASAVLRQFGCAANIIDIYILADDGGQDLLEPSQDLKDELFEAMSGIKSLTDNICIKSGEKITQNISIGVVASKLYIREKEGIEQNLIDRFNRFFRLDNWSFGKILKKSELTRYLAGIPEITALDIVFETNASDLDPDPDVVEVGANQIIRPGSLQVSFSFE